jgi:hypothetical protein
LDGYELYVSFTSPLSSDSDQNGIQDGDEDTDSDGLTNLQEQKHGSNPWFPDTDFDGLTDSFEVNEFQSSPLLVDTDHDGLHDESEYRLGTDPNNPDSDGDGILDGLEVYTQNVSDPETDVQVEITGDGDLSKSVSIADISHEPIFEEVPGLISDPVDIEVSDQFEKAVVKLPYDVTRIPNGDIDNVKMFYLDEALMNFVPLDHQGIDKENGYVWAETDHFTTYVLFYIPTWEAAWEAPLATGEGRGSSGDGNTEVKFIDLMFVIDSSGSMNWNDPNNYRLTAAKSFVDALIQGDRAGVVDFDSYGLLYQSLTADFSGVKNQIDRIDANGGTNIGAGVSIANRELINNSSDERVKIEIVLTDGEGSYSPHLTTEAKENNITIYTIGLGSSIDETLLRNIATETGGQYYSVSSAEQLPEVFSRISDVVVEDEAVDTDADGIPDSVELSGYRDGFGRIHYTLPYNPDSDGDGISDGAEGGTQRQSGFYGDYYRSDSNPNSADTDSDGLTDLEEETTGTKKFIADSDYDKKIDSEDENPLYKDIIDVTVEAAKLSAYFAKGMWGGIKDAGLDAWEALKHPVDTGKAIYEVSKLLSMFMITQDPKYLQPLIDAFGEQIQNEIEKWDTGDRYQRAEQIGYHFSGILLTVIGTKGVDKVLKILKSRKGDLECNCFTAGTKVLTDEGEKPIEDIEVGDKVLAKSDVNGEVAYKEVVGLFQKQSDEIYSFYVGNEVIEATKEHPVWIDGRGWTEVKDLKVGDLLVTSDGRKMAIDKIVKEPRVTTVYNFEVANYNSYFVSNLGIWVHNCSVFGFEISNLPNMTKSEILDNLPKGWKYTENNGFVHVRDENGVIRMRIDPPDKVTKYDHVHLYNENGESLDINGNVVDKKSPDAHIPYKK